MKILVADDDAMLRVLLEGLLSQRKYEVVFATNGLEAWDHIIKGDIDIAIVDWMMPKMDGISLCRKIRQTTLPRYLYAIMLTSRNDAEDVMQGLEAGADDYLRKPFEASELYARLKVGQRTLERINALEKALTDVRTLSELLPICGCCKKVRDDKGYWNQVESYMHERYQTVFKHALCPDCIRKAPKVNGLVA